MISIIAAVGENMELGKNGDLCWRIKADLRRFKKLTTDHTVVMGYRTYKSLGKALPSRTNVVITREFFETNDSILQYLDKHLPKYAAQLKKSKDEVFIIGGGKLYEYFVPIADKIYLTKIKKSDPDADTFFPNEDNWGFSRRRIVEEDNKEYSYEIHERIE